MDTMVISPDSTIEKQKNQHTHNFERTGLSNELCIVVNWYVSRVFFRHFGETLFLFSSPKKR